VSLTVGGVRGEKGDKIGIVQRKDEADGNLRVVKARKSCSRTHREEEKVRTKCISGQIHEKTG